jgi:hypothetical protein
MRFLTRLRRKLANYKLWRSQSWNRGHRAGYHAAVANSDRDLVWTATLEKYYYSHANNCLKTKCKVCKNT